MSIDTNKDVGGENADMAKSGGAEVNKGIFGPNPDQEVNVDFGKSMGKDVNASAWTSPFTNGHAEPTGK